MSLALPSFAPPIVSSPREFLQRELVSQISGGAIPANDRKALSGALDEIDAAFSKEFSSKASSPPDSAEIDAKIDGLITAQVKAGKLTSDQADELKQFLSGPADDGPDEPDSSEEPNGWEESADTEGASGAVDPSKTMVEFLRELQSSQDNLPRYGSNGQHKMQTADFSLLLDYRA
jgi:hypothetical protein